MFPRKRLARASFAWPAVETALRDARSPSRPTGAALPRLKRTRASLFAAFVIVGSMVLLGGSTAHATNFGSAGVRGTGKDAAGNWLNGVWLTNNTIWNVGRRGLTATYSAGVYAAVEEEYEPTDLTAYAVTTSSCPDSTYDVCVYDADYGDNGLYGWNACAGSTSGTHPTQRCSLDWVRINLRFSPPAKSIACHELGHSVGLRHSLDQASCMSATGWSSDLTAHDRAHINATAPNNNVWAVPTVGVLVSGPVPVVKTSMSCWMR